MTLSCRLHPGLTAHYQCDGCRELLCRDCIEESHVLLLCRLCGERALPLYRGHPATVAALDKQRRRARPYDLADALFYPFRGSGLYLFLVVLFCLTVVGLLRISHAFLPVVPEFASAVLWIMIVDLQYKIVRSTADGDIEIPDWADFTDFASLVFDAARSVMVDFISLLFSGLNATWYVLHVLMIMSFGYFAAELPERIESSSFRLDYGLGLAFALWLAAAFSVMAFGAAGTYSRDRMLAVRRHFQGFVAVAGDAVWITNTIFGLGASIILLQIFFEDLPLAGAALSGLVSAYWALTFPHFAGLLFRRHSLELDQIYQA